MPSQKPAAAPSPPQARTELLVCCCGCSLRNGLLTLGWIRLVCTLLALVYFLHKAATVEEEVRAAVRLAVLGDPAVAGASEADIDRAVADAVAENRRVQAIKVLYILYAVLMALDFSLSGLLLTGVYKESSRLLRAWVAVALGSLGVHILLALARAVLLFVSGAAHLGAAGLVGLVVGTAIALYYIRIVRRYRVEMLDSPPFQKMDM